MPLNTQHAARLFAFAFFAILTLMLVDAALIAMYSRAWGEIVHVETLQAGELKDIDSLKVDIAWSRAAVQELHDQVEKQAKFHGKQKAKK